MYELIRGLIFEVQSPNMQGVPGDNSTLRVKQTRVEDQERYRSSADS